MSKESLFTSPYHSAKIIEFKKNDNYSYFNFIQELKELKESLQENVDNDYKLLSILYTAMNKYNENNGEIYKSCSDAFNNITSLPTNLNKNLRKTKIKLIIIKVIRAINGELQRLQTSKTTNTNDEKQSNKEDR